MDAEELASLVLAAADGEADAWEMLVEHFSLATAGRAPRTPEEPEPRNDGTLEPEDGQGDEREELWRELGAVLAEADPLPSEAVEVGRDSFTWRTIDVELAELAHDSSESDPRIAVARASRSPRLLTFEAPGLTVELEVTAVGTRRRLIGQLVPPRRGLVTVRYHQGKSAAIEADDFGRFRAEDLPAGLCSLRCHLAGADEDEFVVTDWVTL